MSNQYDDLGHAIGIGSAAITFIGAYLYGILTGGFLLGPGLGWLPSGIVALLVYAVMRYAWRLVAMICMQKPYHTLCFRQAFGFTAVLALPTKQQGKFRGPDLSYEEMRKLLHKRKRRA